MILRARIVVTMDGAPIENGAVAIEAKRIVDVGRFPEISARHSGQEIVDLGEQALLPGLINAHCHLDYTCLRGKISKQRSFAEWIRAINAEKAKLSSKDYVMSINEGFTEARRFGTTTIANLTAFPELISQVQPLIRTWWFAELIDVREPSRANEIADLASRFLKAEENRGLAPHALFTASPNLYGRCAEVSDHDNLLLSTHLAESREEMEMFRDASGPLYAFMSEIGRDMSDCSGITPLERFVGTLGDRALTTEWIVAHLNEIEDSDFDLLAGSTSKLHVVHSPRSHRYFGHSPFQLERLRALGFNICLGTDSLASNNDLNLFAEMRAFQREFTEISPKEILTMVTVNPAQALRRKNVLGKICRGAHVDLVAIPYSRGDFFEAIVGFEGDPWLMSDGEATGS